MTIRTIPAAFLGMALAAAPAIAQDGTAGRYQMERTEEGIIRLDTLTGEMVVCRARGARVTCERQQSGAGVPEGRIAELEARISELEARIEALEAAPREPSAKKLPDEAEVEHAFDMMERFMRRFFDVFRDLEKERKQPETPPLPPAPDRT